MKRLLTGLLLFTAFYASAQVSPAVTPPSGTKLANTNQAFIWRNGGGDTTRLFLRLGASGITADYYEIKNGTGGGGGITIDTNRLMYLDKNQTSTAFKSFTGRASVSNSGNLTGNALDVFSNSSSLAAIEANNGAGGLAVNAITTTATALNVTNTSSTLPAMKSTNINAGPHAQFGSTTGKIATVANSGNIITPKASASNHVVIKSQLDSLGALIGGGGTVTSFSKTDGIGIISSVANPTTTPNHTIRVDTTVIATKNYLDTALKYRSNRILKDFYTDSTTVGTTITHTYRYYIPANTLATDGDKVVCQYTVDASSAGASSSVIFAIGGGGVQNIPLISNDEVKINVTMIRISSTFIRVSVEVDGKQENIGNNFSTLSSPLLTSLYLEATSGSISAKMGYIEFKPAAL